jgi:hypothetical protein
MARINAEEVKNIREALKAELPEFKFSVTKTGNSGVTIVILSGCCDFVNDCIDKEPRLIEKLKVGGAVIDKNSLNSQWKGKTLEVLTKIVKIARSQGWYDNSDYLTDYFDTAYYIWLYVGSYNKPYIYKGD